MMAVELSIPVSNIHVILHLLHMSSKNRQLVAFISL